MVAPTQVYQQPPERRGASRRSVIDEANAQVPAIDLADLLCGPGKMRKIGTRWVANCPLPGHEDRTPSFTVFLDANRWWCFGACQRGGDVVDLAAAAWGYGEGEMAMAAADLLREYGHEIPERPPSWFAKQVRQAPVRKAVEEAKLHLVQRRLYRVFLPLLEKIQDPNERHEEEENLWDDAARIATLVVSRAST